MTKFLVFSLFLMLLLGLMACGAQDNDLSNGESETGDIQLTEQEDVPYKQLTNEELPGELQGIIEEIKLTESNEIIVIGEHDYILITMGEQKTGGYEIIIHQVVEVEDEVRVWYEFITPAKDEMVTEAITYPFAIVQIDHTAKPIVVKKVEAPK
jgi:hypothetical protein